MEKVEIKLYISNKIQPHNLYFRTGVCTYGPALVISELGGPWGFDRVQTWVL